MNYETDSDRACAALEQQQNGGCLRSPPPRQATATCSADSLKNSNLLRRGQQDLSTHTPTLAGVSLMTKAYRRKVFFTHRFPTSGATPVDKLWLSDTEAQAYARAGLAMNASRLEVSTKFQRAYMVRALVLR